jgi:hypothetical protein
MVLFERLRGVLSESYQSLARRGLRHFGFCAASVAMEVCLGRVGFVEPEGGELSMLSKGRADRELSLALRSKPDRFPEPCGCLKYRVGEQHTAVHG